MITMCKRLSIFLIVIPILFTVFAVSDHGFFCRAGVSLSCAAIVWLTAGLELRRTKWWVVAGLIVSVFGDWFMVQRGNNPNLFICAICLFFMAHACFCVFCLVNGRINKWFLLVLLMGYLPFFFVALRPALMPQPALLVAVLAYLLMSCVSLAAAVGLRLPTVVRVIYIVGIALFVFSDTIIALRVFAKYNDLSFLILPTYFASHVVLALALTLMGSFFDRKSRIFL